MVDLQKWATETFPAEYRAIKRLWRMAWKLSRTIAIAAIVCLSIPALLIGFTVGKFTGTTNVYNYIPPFPTASTPPVTISSPITTAAIPSAQSLSLPPSSKPPLGPSDQPKKRLEEIAELEKSAAIVRRIYTDGNRVLEAFVSGPNVSQLNAMILGIRDRSIATSEYQSQIFGKYHFDDINNNVRQAPMIAGACNHLVALINNGNISSDLQQEPAYLDFLSAIGELKSWLDDAEPKLKSMRADYEKTNTSAN